ncbi:MAG: PQQ-dependent sugar dehydrogenase [Terriglobia bacterium]
MKTHAALFLLPILLLLLACQSAPESPESPELASAGIPAGFQVQVFAEDLGRARFMAFGPDGVLYVSSIRAGTVLALPDRNHDGTADAVVIFADGLRAPHGLAWQGNWLYVGETHQVVRLRDTDGDLGADAREVVVPNLPPNQMHFTRTVGFGPDGGLYVSVGSSCNVCEDEPRRAAILRFNADGSGGETYARGLRNAVGFTWRPGTEELWATDNGRDWLGDDLPPEELDLVVRGGDYGWPYCYGNRVPDPEFNDPARCRPTLPATFEMQAHSAPLGLTFYDGQMFPAEYHGDSFIAFHGSWNRSIPTGYKVVRVRFQEGRPVAIEDFVDIWFKGGKVSGRPVDLTLGPEGALYISDDHGGRIFRLTYQKE